MLPSLTVFLVCQLAGEAMSRGGGIPVPGPVMGMALLLGILLFRGLLGRVLPAAVHDGSLETTGRGLLVHLSLLFVPAGVGVVQRLDVFATHGIALAAALVISTLAALLATAATFVLVARRLGAE